MSKNTNENKYPWCGCGASKDITGCRFSIAPMSDNYVDIILGAVENVDTSKVWSKTDKLSTIYRGRREHVIDAVKAFFVAAYTDKVHMTMEATFSKGCPGDTDADCYLSEDNIPANEKLIADKSFNVLSKIAFYPLGVQDYMEHIAYVVNLAIKRGLYKESTHYVSILEGDISDLFTYFNDVMEYAENNISHYTLQVTLSVNSPTAE